MKFTILVNPFLVIITTFLGCLIYVLQLRRRFLKKYSNFTPKLPPLWIGGHEIFNFLSPYPTDATYQIANKTSNVSSIFRYQFYSNIMYNYPKMHLPYDKFIRQLPRLQNYLTDPKYWKNKNKFGEKKDFLKNFHFNT